jgi:hypothetical protein
LTKVLFSEVAMVISERRVTGVATETARYIVTVSGLDIKRVLVDDDRRRVTKLRALEMPV